MTGQPMTVQEHRAQEHDGIYLSCKICWRGVTFDPAPAPDVEPISAPVTYAEMRSMERVWERIEASKPSASGLCRRCGTYCYGDCSAAR